MRNHEDQLDVLVEETDEEDQEDGTTTPVLDAVLKLAMLLFLVTEVVVLLYDLLAQ
jgi:hypothetical protein